MHSARHFTHDQAVYRGKTPGIRPTGIPSCGVLHSRKGSGFAPLVCPDISGSAEPEHRPSHIRRQVPSQCDTLMYESATADWCLKTESPPPRLPRCGNSGRQMPDSNPKRPDSRSHSIRTQSKQWLKLRMRNIWMTFWLNIRHPLIAPRVHCCLIGISDAVIRKNLSRSGDINCIKRSIHYFAHATC